MSNVHTLNMVTRLDLPVERILDGATKAKLESVVVMGYRDDGTEYFASSYADGGDVLWLMERCKRKLMDIAAAAD
jgi:hypothetical protein